MIIDQDHIVIRTTIHYIRTTCDVYIVTALPTTDRVITYTSTKIIASVLPF